MLRYHAAIGWTGAFGLLFSLGMLVLAAFVEDALGRWLCIATFSVMGLASGYTLLTYRKCALIYDSEDIHYFPLTGPSIIFAWQDICDVEFLIMSGGWILSLTDGRRAKVGQTMHGAGQLMEYIGRRTGLEIPSPPEM
jgi:hypothetical protein